MAAVCPGAGGACSAATALEADPAVLARLRHVMGLSPRQVQTLCRDAPALLWPGEWLDLLGELVSEVGIPSETTHALLQAIMGVRKGSREGHDTLRRLARVLGAVRAVVTWDEPQACVADESLPADRTWAAAMERVLERWRRSMNQGSGNPTDTAEDIRMLVKVRDAVTPQG